MQCSTKKPKLNRFDQFLWAWLCGAWAGWRSALCIVKPATVVAWHRKRIPIVLDLEGPPRSTRPPAVTFAAGCGQCPRRPPQAFPRRLLPAQPVDGPDPGARWSAGWTKLLCKNIPTTDLSCQNLPTTGRLSYRAATEWLCGCNNSV